MDVALCSFRVLSPLVCGYGCCGSALVEFTETRSAGILVYACMMYTVILIHVDTRQSNFRIVFVGIRNNFGGCRLANHP